MENQIKKYLIYLGIFVIYSIQVVIIFFMGFEGVSEFLWRLFGLIGTTSLFLGIVTSTFIKQIQAIFNSTYIRVHHYFSILGLVLLTAHPITMAIQFGTLAIFIPDLSSWMGFWEGGGRLAIYLIYISVLSALLRKKILDYWQFFHALIYVAFFFGAIHGILIGDDLTNPVLLVIYLAMIVIVVLIFIQKRISRRKLKK